jgi:hypothetical protein
VQGDWQSPICTAIALIRRSLQNAIGNNLTSLQTETKRCRA